MRDVGIMTWVEIQKILGERYFSGEVEKAVQVAARFQWGGGLNDQKRKSLETFVAAGDKRARDNSKGCQNRLENWREYPFCERC